MSYSKNLSIGIVIFLFSVALSHKAEAQSFSDIYPSGVLQVNSEGMINVTLDQEFTLVWAMPGNHSAQQQMAELLLTKIGERMKQVRQRCERFVDDIGIHDEPVRHFSMLQENTAKTLERLAGMSPGDKIEEIDMIRAFLYNHAQKTEHRSGGASGKTCNSFMELVTGPDVDHEAAIFINYKKSACEEVERANVCLNKAYTNHKPVIEAYRKNDSRGLVKVDGSTRGAHRGITVFPQFNEPRRILVNSYTKEKYEKIEGVVRTPSGLLYRVIKEGYRGGDSPSGNDVVKVEYTGFLTNGVMFDSSYERADADVIPISRLIDGLTEGIQLMRVGAEYEFYIPSELAYGDSPDSNGPIAPGSDLIFRIELRDIE